MFLCMVKSNTGQVLILECLSRSEIYSVLYLHISIAIKVTKGDSPTEVTGTALEVGSCDQLKP